MRTFFLASLCAMALSALSSCAVLDDDDNPFPKTSSANSDVPVAGAEATPHPDSSAGWQW